MVYYQIASANSKIKLAPKSKLKSWTNVRTCLAAETKIPASLVCTIFQSEGTNRLISEFAADVRRRKFKVE